MVQPGRSAQGPDENCGAAGRIVGLVMTSLSERLRSGGGAWPALISAKPGAAVKWQILGRAQIRSVSRSVQQLSRGGLARHPTLSNTGWDGWPGLCAVPG